jgi:2'-5' RNA ligase
MIDHPGVDGSPPVPPRFVDRWRAREDLPPDDGVVYWHVLMNQAPDIRAGAIEAQRTLAGFPGLHLTPRAWLHMTIMPICRIHELTPTDSAALVAAARERLAAVPAIEIETSQLLYHPEAVVLRLRPGRDLAGLAEAVGEATAATLSSWTPNGHLADPWIPHVTIAYSTTDKPAPPIVAAAGHHIRLRRAVVSEVTLVEQWGPERSWDWRVVDTVRTQTPEANSSAGA